MLHQSIWMHSDMALSLGMPVEDVVGGRELEAGTDFRESDLDRSSWLRRPYLDDNDQALGV